MPLHTVYLGLGSSVGDRRAHLRAALSRMILPGALRVTAVSPVYESPHLGLEPRDETRYPPHLNCVARLETTLAPDALLDHLRAVETAGGRERTQKWGPRTIDLDILLYGETTYQSEQLTIPHPGLTARAFVVVPLFDLAPDLILPDGRALQTLRQSESILGQPLERTAMDWDAEGAP
jgi:2-amino-4-hydroxy-6-hydroxymethyldihydropteridine diphosphokinase